MYNVPNQERLDIAHSSLYIPDSSNNKANQEVVVIKVIIQEFIIINNNGRSITGVDEFILNIVDKDLDMLIEYIFFEDISVQDICEYVSHAGDEPALELSIHAVSWEVIWVTLEGLGEAGEDPPVNPEQEGPKGS